MAHSHHDHHHHHGQLSARAIDRAFLLGIGLNLFFVLAESIAGFYANSLALLTDAGHNLSDVGVLGMALLAFRLARQRPTNHFTYGYRKFTVLASLVNALLFVGVVGAIGYEITRRIWAPPPVPGFTVAAVAAIGIVVNALSAWLFHRDKEKDLNVKSAYLHLMADAAISVGVVVSGLLLHFTDWRWLDPLVGFAVLLVILWSTWGLLRDSIRLALDGVPAQIQPLSIREEALRVPGIVDIHHVHVWAISTMENALTAHLVLQEDLEPVQIAAVKSRFRHSLEHLNIRHATLETEFASDACLARDCG